MTNHTITLKELDLDISYSVKDNSPRGCHTVSGYDLKVGDKVVIDNYFTEIVEDTEPETPETTTDTRINLYDWLNMVGNVEVYVNLFSDRGEEKHLFVGYPEELQEHLELAFSTMCYKVVFIDGIVNDALKITVIEV